MTKVFSDTTLFVSLLENRGIHFIQSLDKATP